MPLLVIKPWGLGGERIRRGLIGEGTATGTVGIVDAVRFEGASGSGWISCRVRCVRIQAEFAGIFSTSRRGTQENSEEKPHKKALYSTLTPTFLCQATPRERT